MYFTNTVAFPAGSCVICRMTENYRLKELEMPSALVAYIFSVYFFSVSYAKQHPKFHTLELFDNVNKR